MTMKWRISACLKSMEATSLVGLLTEGKSYQTLFLFCILRSMKCKKEKDFKVVDKTCQGNPRYSAPPCFPVAHSQWDNMPDIGCHTSIWKKKIICKGDQPDYMTGKKLYLNCFQSKWRADILTFINRHEGYTEGYSFPCLIA